MGHGNAITLVPARAELTAQEAANLLNISRPALIQLLEDGSIDSSFDGSERRVRFEALVNFKRRLDADRREALSELAAYDQELGI